MMPSTGIWAAPVTAWYRLTACSVSLGLVWASTHWYSWQRTIDLIFGSDMEEYEREIGRASCRERV